MVYFLNEHIPFTFAVKPKPSEIAFKEEQTIYKYIRGYKYKHIICIYSTAKLNFITSIYF